MTWQDARRVIITLGCDCDRLVRVILGDLLVLGAGVPRSASSVDESAGYMARDSLGATVDLFLAPDWGCTIIGFRGGGV